MNKPPRILCIAGSDSGGGAGVQADIKTVTVLGGYASCAITAITAQNTLGVSKISLLRPDLVAAQIHAVLGDIGADAIKIGMLGNSELIQAVFSALTGQDIPVILDPVMVAKGGANLLDRNAMTALTEHALPNCSLLTPNVPEAEQLVGRKITDLEAQTEAAIQLLDFGPKAVLLKGGHMPGDTVADVLAWEEGSAVFESPRIDSSNTHGTGCTLASAIATHIGFGISMEQAVRLARIYVQGAIKNASGFGAGHGPMKHNWQN